MESFRELHIGYFNIISYNTVTVSLKTEVVIRIKASTTTPQFLSDNFWLSSFSLFQIHEKDGVATCFSHSVHPCDCGSW